MVHHQTGVRSHIHCTIRGHDPYIFAVRSDEPDFSGPNAFIYSRASVALWGRVMGSACYGLYPLIIDLVAWGNLMRGGAGFNPQKMAKC